MPFLYHREGENSQGGTEGRPTYIFLPAHAAYIFLAAYRRASYLRIHQQAMAAVGPSSWRLLYENHPYTDLEFPSLNFSIRQGDVKDLPDDPEAAAFIVASVYIQEVPEPESQTTRKTPDVLTAFDSACCVPCTATLAGSPTSGQLRGIGNHTSSSCLAGRSEWQSCRYSQRPASKSPIARR